MYARHANWIETIFRAVFFVIAVEFNHPG